jgi:hypothetical protein
MVSSMSRRKDSPVPCAEESAGRERIMDIPAKDRHMVTSFERLESVDGRISKAALC